MRAGTQQTFPIRVALDIAVAMMTSTDNFTDTFLQLAHNKSRYEELTVSEHILNQ